LSASAPTATTTAKSVALLKGVRGLSLTILHEVYVRGVCSTRDLALDLSLPMNYVRTYLYRLKRYGLVRKVGFIGWTITDNCELLYNINILIEQHKSNIRATLEQHKSNTFLPKGNFEDHYTQLSIEPWLAKSNPGEVEVVVVDMLVKHLNDTGEKFIYLQGSSQQPDYYAIGSLANCDVYAARDAISKLKQEGIIYLIADRSVGKWKLGLKKNFIALLQTK
jgi:hypothetical protein